MIDHTCSAEFHPYTGIGGHIRYSGSCPVCDVTGWGWTLEKAQARFAENVAIPMPPADVLNRAITPADARTYWGYFFEGRGRKLAATTQCSHGYNLTDSCPGCDADVDGVDFV